MATRIREDLDGVVYLGGRTYRAGDEVSDGVRIGGHLTEDGKDRDPAGASSSTSTATSDDDGAAEKSSSTPKRTKSSGKSSSSRSSN